MLLCESLVTHSFPLQRIIAPDGHVIIGLPVQMLSTCVVSSWGAVTNKLRLTLIYTSFCGHTFSFFSSEYSGMELLGHVLSMCLTLRGTAEVFSKVSVLFYSSVQNVYEFKLLHFANATR